MAISAPKPASSGIKLGDIIYVLFKHKWKIAILTLLSIAGAAVFYLRSSPPYMSEAKLMVRYVVESNPVDHVDTTVSESKARGANDGIMKSEASILSSWDLARNVVAAIGEERITRGLPPKTNPITAVSEGLTVLTEKGSNVMVLNFEHPDQELAKTILDTIVTEYFKKHLAIHRSADAQDLVKELLDKAKGDLNTVDLNLKKAKNGSSLPLAQLRVNLDVELSKVRSEYEEATTAEAEQKARVAAISQALAHSAGNDQPASTPAANSPTPSAAPDAAVISQYQTILSSLATLRQHLNTQRVTFLPGSDALKGTEDQIAGLDTKRLAMEKEYPGLIASSPAIAGAPARRMDPEEERTHLAAATARKLSIETRLKELKAQAEELDAKALAISVLERDREVYQGNVVYMGTSLVKAQVDAQLDPKRMPNIDTIQSATPGARDVKRRNQIALGIAAGGPVLAVGMVLLFGLLLNNTIRRPAELEEGMGLPLVMTIPWFSRNQRIKNSQPMGAATTTRLLEQSEPGKAPWNRYHFMRPFAEAIRDRLSSYFDATGNVRKPKLIAVTGYGVGAGTSTLAAGLASSLSETGDGKVLLVDMNGTHGEAHPFFDGEPAVTLTKALRLTGGSARPPESGMRENNLYLARAEAPQGGAATAGLRRMMPALKASDFDYVIFDMPPLGQTKPTATMGALMDKVIVIVEAETNSKSEVRRGYRDLINAGADVSMVFNKARSYGPAALVGA